LTPEVFRTRLTEETLVRKLEDSIAILLEGMLASPADSVIKSLASWADKPHGRLAESGAELSEIGTVAAKALDSFLSSEEFKSSLHSVLGLAVHELSSMPLGFVLPEEKFKKILSAGIERCRSREGAQSMDDLVDALASVSSEYDGELFPSLATIPVVQFLAHSLYSSLIPAIESFLENSEVRDRFGDLVMSVVRDTITKMSPVQRLIVGVANYEKTLEQAMPETIAGLHARLVSILQEDSTKEKLVSSLVSHIQSRGQNDDAPSILRNQAIVKKGIFPIQGIKEALAGFFAGLDQGKEGFIDAACIRYRRIADTSIRELFPEPVETLSRAILDGLQSASVPTEVPAWIKTLWGRGIASFFEAYALRIEGKSLLQVFGLDRISMQKIAAFIAKAVTEALSSQAERLVEALDIRTMVVEKINDLKMADIERIILQVVRNELRWITILGGVLGAIIGLIQSLLTMI
jgi:hypothetical protein